MASRRRRRYRRYKYRYRMTVILLAVSLVVGAFACVLADNTAETEASTAQDVTTAEAECQHVWDEGVVTDEAESEAGEVRVFTCTLCGATKTMEVVGLEESEHRWSKWKDTKSPTLCEPGEKTRKCRSCGEIETEIITPLCIEEYAEYDSFILVDKETQKLCYIREGKVVLSTDVLTGTKGQHETPSGTYKIHTKKEDTILYWAGKAWDVDYWIAFDGDLIGFHDAGWRTDEEIENPDQYLTDGSHGCVNMKKEDVRVLYEEAPNGTVVIIR